MKLTRSQRARLHGRRKRGGFWLTLLLFIALELLRPKPKIENAKPLGLGDFRIPTATEGRPLPLIWGTVRIEGPNVIWYGDLNQEAIIEKVKTGLFSSQRVTRGFRYHLGLQQALCQGATGTAAEEVTLRKVWIGDKVVGDFTSTPIVHDGTFTIDRPNLFGGEDLGRGGVVGTLRFHAGTNDQAPSDYLGGRRVTDATTIAAAGTGYAEDDVLTEDGDGVGPARATFNVDTVGGSGEVLTITRITGGLYTTESASPADTTVAPAGGTGCTLTLAYGTPFQDEGGATPAYRDTCYVDPDVVNTLLGTSDSIDPWKWELRRIPDGLALPGGEELVDGGVNPMNVIYEFLTNSDWGRGIATGKINTSNFSTAAATLATEGNGFSFLLDRQIDDQDLLRMVEEQIGGVVFENPLSGQWEVKLIRDDFDIDTVPEITGSGLIEVKFSRVTWESTTNQVRVPFNDQADEYKATFGFAQDMANVLVVGTNISTTVNHPGVKTGSLANAIAWRELRVLSTPLAQANLIVDRSFYGLLPGDPFAFTDPDVGFVKLPMRVKSIKYGNLLDGKITIDAVQDVFVAAAGVFDDPPSSNWDPPGDDLVAYPVGEQLAFEAPRALTFRDPNTVDPESFKVYAAARKQSNEAVFEMRERHNSGAPIGAYSPFGSVTQFQLIGRLNSALNLSGTNPVGSILVVPDPDTQSAIETAFPDVADVGELGTELISLILIDDEFLLVTSAQTSTSNVQLNTVYRGVLDSVQADHNAGASVFLLFVGAGMSDTALPPTENVEVKLIPQNAVAELTEGDATLIAFTMANRTSRPYPPAAFDLNSVTLDTTLVDLDGSGSGEDVGVLIDAVIRRDFRTVDEIQALSTDAAALFADFPTINSTEIEIQVLDGVTVLHTETGISGTSATARQLDILQGLDTTTLPASLTFRVRESHTLDSVVYTSRVYLEVVATIASELIGEFAWGVLDDGDISPIYDVQSGDDATDHDFTLSTAFSVGDVEYRLDGGSFLQLIAQGGTTGSIPNAGLSVGTDIEIRHLSSDTTPQKLLVMDVGGAERAYAVLIS